MKCFKVGIKVLLSLIIVKGILLIPHNRNPQCRTKVIPIEYFDKGLSSWHIRDATRREAYRTYSIKREGNNRFLRATSYRSSIQIAKRVNWHLSSFPVISWRWRVHRVPRGANEQKRGRNDSAAAIYVVFLRNKIPYLSWRYQPINFIKYVWSTSLPAGRVINKIKKKIGATIYEGRFIVLQSGRGKIGQWITEQRNVIRDYRMAFGKTPKKNPVLVAILTDSNDTKSSAIADYDTIVIKRE